MFHPDVCDERLRKLEDAFHPGFTVQPHSVAEVEEMVHRLAGVHAVKGKAPRPLEEAEARFVVNERLLVQSSFEYWATRYAMINVGGARLGRMNPFLDTQAFILGRLAEAELAVRDGEIHDGILCNLLKGARQVGGSTFAEAVAAYRMTTEEHLFALIAADVPETSAFMFDIYERIIENLPWWLAPKVEEHVKNKEMKFDTECHVWVGSGKSTRGTEGQRGQLGRGKTLGFCHLSELSTWEVVQIAQIRGSLLPTIHRLPTSFVFFESTAKGRHNWWHSHWKASRGGNTRFKVNIFIPWYVEPRYSLPAPPDWSPASTTLSHARHCEETSQAYLGRVCSLSRDQLYWYERTREEYESEDDLKTFVEEYGSVTDDECFQHSGRSVFSTKVQQRVRDQARPLLAQLEVVPMRQVVRG
jgi:hypothetical protein